MTTGLKIPSSYYMELINTFPPRPITNDAELIAMQNRINQILDRSKMTPDDRDYLKILGMLVYEYEEKHELLPPIKGVELLKALLEESNLQPQDLDSILNGEDSIDQIPNDEIKLTDHQIERLAAFFKISPAAFR
ncbi:MAG: transcriptional regulator [Cyanosarcina radialis HA8281-LM2]|jgi:HTH-type transcriptional regulator/antitoxin HigA|nr:transcriptional regulator [Cyanosarcina radialis HA8281-LM2]